MKTNYLFFLLIFFNPGILKAQENISTASDTSSTEEIIYVITETSPEFPGGNNELYQYLGQNMRYPAKAQDKNVQGTVYISFVVEKDGSLTGLRCLKGIGSGCDEEAMRVVKTMPNWTPGMQDGKIVRVRFNLPIVFKLQGTFRTKEQRKEDKARKKEEDKKLRSSSTFEEF